MMLNKTGKHGEYGYLSTCWGEANFINVFRAPIVFRHMAPNDANQHILSYAGTKEEVFDPEKLFIDADGILLHEVASHEHLRFASFDTNLACELAENL